jgi:response regulator RpfG family c-di-GMP phosphodiesterase
MNEQNPKTGGVSEAAEPPRILVVDDHQAIREVLSEILNSEGYVVRTAENGAVALQELMQNHYNLVMTDLRMPVMDGEKLLKELAKNNIKRIVIVLTAFATVETAIETMKCGAYDYIMKPFKPDEIRLIVQRALEKDRLERENAQLEEALRLYQISEEMTSTLSLDRLLGIIVHLARKESKGDVVSLVLRDQDDDKWYSKICDTDLPDASAREIEGLLDLEAIGKAHASGRAILFPPGGPEPYVRGGLNAGRKLHSFMSVPLAIRGKVTGMLNVLSFSQQRILLERDRRTLYMLVNLAANAVDNARLHEELKTSFKQTIMSFSQSIDAMDKYTRRHSERVTVYCQEIAKRMGLKEGEVEEICNAARLHDIGKISLGLESLNKPQPLSTEERKNFQRHPRMGRKILEKIDSFQKLVPIVYYHHEHYDGLGYPERIKGDQIPLGARILAVADAYEAMTHDRPYRKKMSREEAIQELRAHAGTQFDPQVVKVFVSIPPEVLDPE